MNEDYSDIINLPHHRSRNHTPMSMMARAAQFAPFAALSGYDAVINETARLTDSRLELEDYDNDRLNRRMAELMDSENTHPEVTVSFFMPDSRKKGGSYRSITARLKKIDTYEKLLIMEDGTAIPFANIMDILPNSL